MDITMDTPWKKRRGQLASALWENFRMMTWANPVVVRDLRAQMRGTKSYWYMGGYLLLLTVLAIAGYAQATNQGWNGATLNGGETIDIVSAQGRMVEVYGFIFGTLAVLVCLIAPALTAASIVGERQRLSFDLLVTTPLRASELLIGKLVSSVAFLGLLLVLSLPASAFCVMLGGATLPDVFRTYGYLMIDGIVLAAIGLFFSCAVRTNLQAIIGSYVAVGAFLVGTGFIGTTISQSQILRSGMTASPPVAALGMLNPLLTAFEPSMHCDLFHLSVPCWICVLVSAALLIRFCVTAATFRLGVYGAQAAGSLRRQALLLSGLGAYLAADAIIAGWGVNLRVGVTAYLLLYCLSICFLCATPFLTSLFVPISGDDAPSGVPSGVGKCAYRITRAFRPEASGALPLYHLWLLTLLLGGGAGLYAHHNEYTLALMPWMLLGIVYLSGLGFGYWRIAHFAARVVPNASGARGLAFATLALLGTVPLMWLTLHTTPQSNFRTNDLWNAVICFLYYPCVAGDLITRDVFEASYLGNLMAISTGTAYAVGIGFLLLERGVVRRGGKRALAPVAAA